MQYTQKYTRHSLFLAVSLALLPLMLIGCDSGGSAQEETTLSDFDTDAILQQAAGNIYGTYTELESKAQTLEDEVKDLQNNPTAQNLSEAQQAWVAARNPWEASEGFLFGPVATEGLDPALDSWPVDETAIKGHLNSNEDLTNPEVVEGFDDTAHGFHTVEFFLFGPNGNRSVSDLEGRMLDYLITATEVLHGDTEELAGAWEEGAQFRSDFTSGSGPFSGKKASLQQLAEGLNIIADEVGAGKIGTPLNEQSIQSIESKYSENSFSDYASNIRSVKRIYTGDALDRTGPGLDTIVKEVAPEAHDTLMSQINDAISALEQLNQSTSFRKAVESENTSGVEEAQQKILDLRTTIQDEIKPALSNL
jgi:uncharacterized iron-regulated protein